MEKQYDAIVIGAGLGGLTCGAALAKEGWSTLILEGRLDQGDTAPHSGGGGSSSIFPRSLQAAALTGTWGR